MHKTWRHPIWLTIISLLLFSALSYWFWISEKAHTLAETKQRLQSQLSIRTSRLQNYLQDAQHEVLILAEMPPIQGIARALAQNDFDAEGNSSLQQWQQRLNTIFSSYAANSDVIMQVRFIGLANEGRELARVNRSRLGVVTVPFDMLQSKGHRDYYQATKQLSPGQIYISPINLNREHGAIEYPETPTVRIATPVYYQQQFFGMVIINLDMSTILAELADELTLGRQLYLSNQYGDFLLHPDKQRAFAYERGDAFRWQQQFNSPAPDTHVLQEVSLDNSSFYIISHPFSLHNQTGSATYYLTMSVPKRKVLDQVIRQLVFFVAMILLLASIAAAFFYLLLLNIRCSEQISELNNSLESQVKARTAELEQANAAKSDFIANMSHEIRTPMNAILGMLQLLSHTPLNERQADYRRKAEISAQALLGLLNDILDYSKMAANRLQLDCHPFNLHELLRNVGIILSSNAGSKPVEILFDFSPALPAAVLGDALRLQQVLLNLAGNAVKFTERGQVIISVKETARTASHTRLTFDVTDSGIGISAQQWQTIFDEFAQAEASTTRKYGGTGLGLAISKRLTTLMGGELSGHSTPGKGSSFYFSIELKLAQQTPSPEYPLNRKLNVLVVDDNAYARDILQHIVEQFGWQVRTVSSGEAALNILQDEAQPIDILLIDWQMPGMNGIETCKKISELAKEKLPGNIIMVTAYGRELLSQYSEQDIQLLDAYLIKPITPSMLFDTVSNVLQQTLHNTHISTTEVASLVGISILLVEDNLTNQQVASELLQNQGARVETAINGQAAIDKLQSGSHFDVILMDIHMPVMDGYQCTTYIRQTMGLSKIPILALTANAMLEDKDSAIKAGMNDHIAKPFNLVELCDTIVRWVSPQSQAVIVTKNDTPATPDTPQDSLTQFAIAADINLELALKNVAGNTALFLKALPICANELNSNLKSLQKTPADVPQQLSILHALKGMLGTVGAVQLANWCALQERKLKHSRQPLSSSDLNALIQRLQTLAQHIAHFCQTQ